MIAYGCIVARKIYISRLSDGLHSDEKHSEFISIYKLEYYLR